MKCLGPNESHEPKHRILRATSLLALVPALTRASTSASVSAVAAALALSASCSQPAPVNPAPKAAETADTTPSDELRDSREIHLANIQQLTAGGENAEAYWSFSGTELIFQSTRDSYKCDQIFTLDRNGGEPQLVSTGTGRTTCGYFLPGDKEIIYSSTHEDGAECPPPPDRSKGYVWALYPYTLYRADRDGKNIRKLTDRQGYDTEATVCAKDGSIIFTSDRDGDLELYRMDADGKHVRRLTHTPGYDGGAFFSADCSKIVWRASRPKGDALKEFQDLLKQGYVRPSQLEIYVANADGSDARQITYLGVAAFAPFFHPSGKRVLFSTNYGDPSGREFNIWAVNIDGSNLEQITFAEGFDGFPMFSPDGKKLAFASNRNQKVRGETNVFVADWVESKPRVESTAVDKYMADVAWLAADEREGRGVETDGLEASAAWLEKRYQEIGLEPVFEKTGYRQPMDVPYAVSQTDKTRISIDGKTVDAAQFVASSFSSNGAFNGKTVFAGYGISDKSVGVDDYKKVRAKGKIVVVKRFVPGGKAFESAETKKRFGDIYYKAFEARKRGAKALIVVDIPAGNDTKEAALPKLSPALRSEAGIPVVVVSQAVGGGLVKGSHRVDLAVELDIKTRAVHNIAGKISAGAKTPHAGAVVIGAHYDHLGKGEEGSLAKVGLIHNGADDNASGTAALLQVAAALNSKRESLQRDVYIVAFTAEEKGLLGSAEFVKAPPAGLDAKNIVAMLNMDMVGRMRDNRLSVIGSDTSAEWPALVEPLCDKAKILCSLGGSGYGGSDHMSFFAAGAPVLHFFSGGHYDYHRDTDDTDKINGAGGARIAGLVAELAVSVANRQERLVYTKASMPTVQRGDVRLTGASLGTVPAYGDPGPGVLLSDVKPDGPAQKAGLRGGDRIRKIGSVEIRNLRDLMLILRDGTPGQTITIEVIRDGKPMTFKATLGEPRGRKR